MTVLCPKCRRAIRIPPDKQDIPTLKARCAGCGTVFVVAEATLALAPAPEAPASPPAGPAAAPAATAPPRASRPASAGPAPVPRPGPPGAAPTPSPTTRPHPATSATRPPATPPSATRPPATRPPATASRSATGGSGWRRCANHSSVASRGICTQCGKGWCPDCLKTQGSAMICPACDALCVSAADREAADERARMRARSLTAELGTVFGYPLSDKVAYLLLAVFVGVFTVAASFAAFGAGLAILLSQGLLYAYAFTAINRVSAGDLKSFMPNVGDISDLVQPMRVGLAALLISTGPLLLLAFLHPPDEVLGALGISTPAALTGQPPPTPEPTLPPEVQALLEDAGPADEASAEGDPAAPDEAEGADGAEGDAATDATARTGGGDPEPEDSGLPAWLIPAYLGAIFWKILYSPVALVAAAISRSFLATLNPLAGIGAIARMGGIYWSAMAVYTAIAVGEALLVAGLGMVPVAGRFLGAFVQSYTYLATGCLLGLAVFKRAPELGLD